jgi:hypothetical protein
MAEYSQAPAHVPPYATPFNGQSEPKPGMDYNVSAIPDARQPKKKSFSDRMAELNHRFWLFEVAACVLAWVVLLLICGGFVILNKKPINGWAGSVLTFLTNVLKACLMIPVVGSIAQLKWHHFRTADHSGLKALETYNDAARSSIGGLKLIKMFKFR